MKKLIAAIVLIASAAFAEGPRYDHERNVQLEFENVYQDIRSLDSGGGSSDPLSLTGLTVSTITASSATFTTALISSASITVANISTANVQNINGTFIGLGRNRAINGETRIDQANGGASSGSITASSKYSVDMFSGFGTNSAGVFTLQRQTSTPPTGFTHYLRATTTTASASPGSTARYEIHSNIEGTNIRDFLFGTSGAKTFTISFWVRSSLTGTFGIGVLNGGTSRGYVATYAISAADTWEQKRITIPGDVTGTWTITDGSTGIQMLWDLGGGSNVETSSGAWSATFAYRTSACTRVISTNAATWDITGLQFEMGSVATAFEYRPIQVEIAMCQRYYEKSYNVDVAVPTNTSAGLVYFTATTTGGGASAQFLSFKVVKNAAPGITFYTEAGSSGSWTYDRSGGSGSTSMSGVLISVNGFRADTGNMGVNWGAAQWEGHWVADARL